MSLGALTAQLTALTAALTRLAEGDEPALRLQPLSEDHPLEAIAALFRLSGFERALLLLALAAELQPEIGPLCARVQGEGHARPTLSLALRLLPEPHWDALLPAAPLRRWRLLRLDEGPLLTARVLQLEERVLHACMGLVYLDERVACRTRLARPPEELLAGERASVERLRQALSGDRAVLRVEGPEAEALAAAALESLGERLYVLEASMLPDAPAELEELARLCDREAALTGLRLLVDARDLEPVSLRRARILLARLETPVLTRGLSGPEGRQGLRVDLPRPDFAARRACWRTATAGLGLSHAQLDTLAEQLRLRPAEVRVAVAQLALTDAKPAYARLREAARARTRAGLDELTERVPLRHDADELVLPEIQRQRIDELVIQVESLPILRHRWGYSGRVGAGVTALFSGPSGTGKTMAASIVARRLDLDLYRIDLSAVVSKYIGETEKNLRRIFDAAESGGVVLLFDEADALFGKRSEVRDSHDRHANVEVSYLLQRIEAFEGLAILTSNLRQAIDPAFLRRIRVVVEFPFPDAGLRERIWRKVFPPQTPTRGLDFGRLARLSVAGGNIRNISLNAASLAAGRGQEVDMAVLLQAARAECAKLERPLSPEEVRGWV